MISYESIYSQLYYIESYMLYRVKKEQVYCSCSFFAALLQLGSPSLYKTGIELLRYFICVAGDTCSDVSFCCSALHCLLYHFMM